SKICRVSLDYISNFFFFQAEDGIRDLTVTGVQTCALPILAASNRAAEMMREIAGAEPAPEIAIAGELPSSPAEVSLRYQHVDDLIGVAVPPKRVDEILGRFGLEKTNSSEEQSSWRIPSHRFDLQRDVDLIEEVVRAVGIAEVPGNDRSRSTPESDADRS